MEHAPGRATPMAERDPVPSRSLNGNSPTFGFQGLFTLLKTEDPKELLFLWNTWLFPKLKQESFQVTVGVLCYSTPSFDELQCHISCNRETETIWYSGSLVHTNPSAARSIR